MKNYMILINFKVVASCGPFTIFIKPLINFLSFKVLFIVINNLNPLQGSISKFLRLDNTRGLQKLSFFMILR